MKFLDKLKVIYEKYKEHVLIAKQKMSEKDFLYFCNWKLGRLLYDDLVGVFEYKGSPSIISKKAYDELKSLELYHGFKKYKYGHQYITDYDAWKNNELGLSNGFYSTHNIDFAKCYTIDVKDTNANKIFKFKLNNAKGIDSNIHKSLINAIFNEDYDIYDDEQFKSKLLGISRFMKSINKNKDFDDFFNLLLKIDNLSVVLGFDFIISNTYTRLDKSYDEIIILNRGVICITETEFNKFYEHSKVEQKHM